MTKEEFYINADNNADSLVAEYRRLAALTDIIEVVAKEFDGLVYNKRFAERISEISDGIIYAEHPSNDIVNILTRGKIHSYPFATLASVVLTDGNRVSAQDFIAKANEVKQMYLKKAQDIEDYKIAAREMSEEIQEKLEALQNCLALIPVDIRQLYKIPSHIKADYYVC